MTPVVHVEFFEFRGSLISFRRYGHGPTALLAFHGFGQSSEMYTQLGQVLREHFTVYALDLFYHGESWYADDQLITKTYWQGLVNAFLQAMAIDRFSLMGFSLGGRFALALAETLAGRLDQLILIAPDGITRSPWYRLATGSTPGRWLFCFFLRHMSLLTSVGHGLTAVGLLHRTAMRFAENAMGTAEQREQVYQSWTKFRLIRPDLNVTSQALDQHSVRVRVFTGYYDRIVPGTYAQPLLRRLRSYELTVLKAGHNRLVDQVGEILAKRPL
ncbi:alpha/beta hydrolase fold protein [Fibrisoma limi BUZ 3]|uniref:Alpha/beta hydrolase fold protein n=1 Tax=Fibrisoma limi BUZ 3 TaxID=1185876 RepID=I2GS35_9BACT|nr:alpha/beta hydrolase [Fibrisoma limi]CCH56713.1 alpha/beta hydrolase fold protein [Fibrisoma limi BUZ 3]